MRRAAARSRVAVPEIMPAQPGARTEHHEDDGNMAQGLQVQPPLYISGPARLLGRKPDRLYRYRDQGCPALRHYYHSVHFISDLYAL
jgi:hypothetical protein